MSVQEIGSPVVDPKAITGEDKADLKQLAELICGVRLDNVPTNDAGRLATEGKAYPLIVDKNGFLRVTLPEGTKVKTEELEVLQEIRALLEEAVDVLHELA